MQSGLRHLLHQAFTWSLLGAAGIAGFVYFDDVMTRLDAGSAAVQQDYREQRPPTGTTPGAERMVRLAADRNGHFEVEARINSRSLSLLADTGATHVTLTYEDARNVGLTPTELKFTHQTQTANGIAKVAPVVLDRMRVGEIELRDVQAVVTEPGKLHVSLLGMSFLGALTRFEMRGRELVLIQ